jgi:hypothetical protein
MLLRMTHHVAHELWIVIIRRHPRDPVYVLASFCQIRAYAIGRLPVPPGHVDRPNRGGSDAHHPSNAIADYCARNCARARPECTHTSPDERAHACTDSPGRQRTCRPRDA